MAGCECWDWKMAVDSKDIVPDETLGDYMGWFVGPPIKERTQKAIRYCPWCRGILTRPEVKLTEEAEGAE